MPMTIGQICAVTKLRIGVAIALSALAGLAMTPGASVSGWKVGALVLSILMASASAGAFNQYVERHHDRLMPRTRNRLFASGALPESNLWLVGMALLLAAAVTLALFVLGAATALHVFLGAFTYGVVYTVWLKRRTSLNIVIGGLAGSFAVLAGAATVDPWPGTVPMVFAVVLFLWTPPHFWSLAMAMREEYAAAGVPMLPVVMGDQKAAWIILAHTAALVAMSLVPAAYGMNGFYLACAAAGGACFLWCSWRLVRDPSLANAKANFRASLLQLSLLLLGAYSAFWFA
ncbi:Protoheme IX farnesyltransferase 2 [Azospirillaceae bacterium]